LIRRTRICVDDDVGYDARMKMKNNDLSPENLIIVWFRKDLRLDDNHALHAAAQTGRDIIPVYIREPSQHGTGPLGAAQAWWLHHSLTGLGKALGDLESRLILRSGEPDSVLAELIAETGASTVYWNRRYDPNGIAIDGPLKETLASSGIAVKSFAGSFSTSPHG
jgi:deoxyribodipyrimidine photo-lyase